VKKVKFPLTKERAMTPTFLGILAIVITLALGLRKMKWRPYLELVLFFWGVTVGFGGLGITLFKHATESGRSWGWGALVSHPPTGDTLESLFWHGWPAAIAVVMAAHWWIHARRHHKERYG
jgi:hypothetical protein